MHAKNSVFVICVEAIIYLLVHNLHDCTNYDRTLIYQIIANMANRRGNLKYCMKLELLAVKIIYG